MSKGDWIVAVEPLGGYCLRCGESLAMPLPMDASAWLAAMEAWENLHRRCLPNPPEEARRLRQLTEGKRPETIR